MTTSTQGISLTGRGGLKVAASSHLQQRFHPTEILLGKIATSFELTLEETRDLFACLPVSIDAHYLSSLGGETGQNRITVTIDSLERLISCCVPRLIISPEKSFHLLAFLIERSFCEREKSLETITADEFRNGLRKSLNGGHEKAIAEFLESSLVYLSWVNKEDAVLLLRQQGFPFKNDVKGLTRAVYEEIIHKSGLKPSADNLPGAGAEQGEGQVQIEDKPSKRKFYDKNKITSAMIDNFRSELLRFASKESFDKKFVPSTKTIQRWCAGQGRPTHFNPAALIDKTQLSIFCECHKRKWEKRGLSSRADNMNKNVRFIDSMSHAPVRGYRNPDGPEFGEVASLDDDHPQELDNLIRAQEEDARAEKRGHLHRPNTKL